MARKVAIGEQDYSKIIENNCFYVDKTNFIKEWWENRDRATLITRPRRFGKTLTMNMVDYFLSIQHACRGDLFEGLSIWTEEKYRDLQGTYPVIFLSFAGIGGSDYLTVREGIVQELVDVYNKNDFLLDSDRLSDNEKEIFSKICDDMSDVTAMRSLKRLSSLLYRHYGKRAVILLDEYDTPMQEAYIAGYWDKLTGFMRGFFNATFKTNPYLERAIMTGITHVSKESIFSDLNKLEVISTTSEKYETSFGFTSEEVFCALKEFGLENEKSGVKKWYDGFRFGKCDSIYNPWSITKFLEHKEYKNYWVNTSSNALAGKLIREGSAEVKMIMEDLLKRKTFEAQLDEEIVFNQLDYNTNAIWSLLLAGGYLKAVSSTLNKRGKRDYILAVTNLEIENAFEDMLTGWFSNGEAGYNNFEKALLSANLKEMNIYMNKISIHTFSCFDTGKKPSEAAEPERFYHGFVLGLIAGLRERYEVTSNRESGYGRYDVMLAPVNQTDDGIILEFKVIDPDEENSLQDTVNAAITQIIDKKYSAMLVSRGIDCRNIRIYGFAFQGQKVLIDGGYLNEYDLQEDSI